MLATRIQWVWVAVLLSGAGLVHAGPLTGENLVENGEFELDPPDTNLPTGWDIFSSSDGNWQGVIVYGQAGGGHPYPLGDQSAPSQCYGRSISVYGPTSSGSIGQLIPGNEWNDDQEIWVGGWVYTADIPGAYVQFHLDQADTGTSWSSPQIHQLAGSDPIWSWHEFLVPAAQGFDGGEVLLTVDIVLTTGHPMIGLHGMFIDGIEVERPGEAGCPVPFADADGDGDVDQEDFGVFQQCYTGRGDPGGVFNPELCGCFDRGDDDNDGEPDSDEDIDQVDRRVFESCATGPGITLAPEDWPLVCQ